MEEETDIHEKCYDHDNKDPKKLYWSDNPQHLNLASTLMMSDQLIEMMCIDNE